MFRYRSWPFFIHHLTWTNLVFKICQVWPNQFLIPYSQCMVYLPTRPPYKWIKCRKICVECLEIVPACYTGCWPCLQKTTCNLRRWDVFLLTWGINKDANCKDKRETVSVVLWSENMKHMFISASIVVHNILRHSMYAFIFTPILIQGSLNYLFGGDQTM